MTQRTQIYWEQADWALLVAYIANPTTYLAKVVVDGNYLEDLRKRIWLLEHIHAGHYNGTPWVQVGAPGAGTYGNIQFRIGKKLVTVEDAVYGTTWWINNSDVTFGMYYYSGGPPTNIHPSDNEWITQSGIWTLYPNPNRYHHYDVNVPHIYIDSTVIGSEGTDNLKKCVINEPAYNLYSRQVDPRMQYPSVYYKDTQKYDAQYKEKVAFDRKFITQPDTLGPVYTAWRYRQKNPLATIVVKDAWGLKSIGGYAGNQYANTNTVASLDDAGSNSPGGGIWRGNDYPDRQPFSGADVWYQHAEWSWNPKNNHAYQNRIEILLSMKFTLPADAVYTANFRDKYDYPDDSVDTYEEWHDYPNVNEDMWGENESGFELFLKKSGSYDWYFDYDYRKRFTAGDNTFLVYTQADIIVRVLERVINEGLDWPTAIADFDLTSVGSWRRTWKYSLGRISPYMRSREMGEPSRHDTWNPDPLKWDKTTQGDWYGSRKETFPLISEFDDKSKAIISTADEFTFKVASDITADLKVGWLVHLTTSISQKIYDGANWIPAASVTAIVYDSETDKTTVKTTERYSGYSLLMWNKEVSQRHDAGQIIYNDDMTKEPEYELTAHVIKEMHELLLLNIYTLAYVGITNLKYGYFKRDNKIGDTLQPRAWVAKYHDEMMAEFNWDPTTWPGGGSLDVRSYVIGAWRDVAGTWSTWYGAVEVACGVRFETIAFIPVIYLGSGKLTAQDLSDLSHSLLIRLAHYDSVDLSGQPGTPWPGAAGEVGIPKFTQRLLGITNTIVTAAIDQEYGYNYLPALPRAGNAYLFMIPEVNPATWIWEPETVPGQTLYNFGGICEMGIDDIIGDDAIWKLDWENVPIAVWHLGRIGHIDAPRAPYIDTQPPRPNPPIFHSRPQAYFEYILEQGSPGDVDYIAEHFDLYIKAESILCQDYEGSDPVKYRIVGEDSAPTGEWTTSRTCLVKIKELTRAEAERETKRSLPAIATTKPSGTVTRFTFPHSKGITTGDILVFEGTLQSDGEQTIVNVDSAGTYFDIDKGMYIAETPSGATIYNKSKGFDTLDWQYEAAKDYKFAIQAKDANVPHNNISDISEYVLVAEPETWPMELV